MSKLVQLLRYPRWQIQANALNCIPKLYESVSALEYLKTHNSLYMHMWEKIADKNKNVRQLALQNFVWLSQA